MRSNTYTNQEVLAILMRRYDDEIADGHSHDVAIAAVAEFYRVPDNKVRDLVTDQLVRRAEAAGPVAVPDYVPQEWC